MKKSSPPTPTSSPKSKDKSQTRRTARLALIERIASDAREQQNEYQKTIERIMDSPSFKIAQQTWQSIQGLSQTLAQPIAKIQETFQSYSETYERAVQPFIRLQEQMRSLDGILGSNAPVELILPPPQQNASVENIILLQQNLDELKAWFVNTMEKALLNSRVDTREQRGILSSDLKNKRANCKHCGAEVLRAKDISYLFEGTMKCKKCNETLQLPRDLTFANI